MVTAKGRTHLGFWPLAGGSQLVIWPPSLPCSSLGDEPRKPGATTRRTPSCHRSQKLGKTRHLETPSILTNRVAGRYDARGCPGATNSLTLRQ